METLLSQVEVIKTEPLCVGRAAEALVKQMKINSLSKTLMETCPGAWAGGTLKSPLGVDIDEFGNVTICPGLSIGNTRETNLKTIIEGYDYQDFAVIAKLQDKGIKGLMNLASESGYVPREAYVNGCHFCYETRKFLRNIYPEAFVFPTPSQFRI